MLALLEYVDSSQGGVDGYCEENVTPGISFFAAAVEGSDVLARVGRASGVVVGAVGKALADGALEVRADLEAV